MGLGERLEGALHWYRRRRRLGQAGPAGDFYRAGGEELLVRDLALEEGAHVLDVGGFEGEWSSGILVRYAPRVTIFEPIPQAVGALRGLFAHNPRVTVIPEGLSSRSETARLSLRGNSSSQFAHLEASPTIEARMLDVAEFFARTPGQVACMKLNIEGSEYDLLERMCERSLLDRVDTFLIQFHRAVPDFAARRAAIRAALERTHRAAWSFDFVWERWDRRRA